MPAPGAGLTRLDAEYVLPLRWQDDEGLAELTAYLVRLARLLDVTVVDGSAPEVFERHARAWRGLVRHLPPAPRAGRNGKVRGVVTGLRTARHEHVVLADDDVRHTPQTLARAVALLEDADLVVPQNVFTSWPWHARWDTARQLVNRALAGDHPGTLVLRRGALGPAGYDGDVLFENLELVRTVGRRGGTVRRAPGLLVGRRPPTARHFWSQRVRQAYDDFAQPGRLVAEAAVVPLLVLAGRRRRRAAAALALLSVATAETGRRRQGGRAGFPPSSALWAPVWLAERAVCVWVAAALRLRGGVRYGDGRLLHAASPRVRRAGTGPPPTRPTPTTTTTTTPTTTEGHLVPPTEHPPSITAYPDGPLILRGDVELLDVDGRPIPRRDGPVALCRCGLSSIKPFCDSTHTRSGFTAD